MRFNKRLCRVLHLGKTNPMHQYMSGATQFLSSLAEKDLKVLMDTKLDTSEQHAREAKAANCILGCIRSPAKGH